MGEVSSILEAAQVGEEINSGVAEAKRFRFKSAACDLWAGVKRYNVWLLLGWLDLRLRYRRSYLGPFWITISMAVMIYSMGFIYSKLFQANLAEYFLYVSGGMLAWVFLSTTLIEMMNCFVEASSLILQVKMPCSVYILRIITRNFIILGHNLLAVLPLLIVFKCMPNSLMILFTLLVTFVSMFSFGMLFAMVGVRFRDVQQVITSVLQVGFMLTPIMWKAEMIPGRAVLAVYLNPFYYFVELFRSSLLNVSPPALVVWGGVVMALGGTLLMVTVFSRMCHRIPFWV